MKILDGYNTKTAELAAGLITILVQEGVGRWCETEPLPEGDTPAISLGDVGTHPIRALGLNIYTAQTDVEPGVDKIGAVFLIRTPEQNPLEAVKIADKLEDVLHGREHNFFKRWHVPVMWRHSLADLGPNENGHYQLTDTYHFYVDIYREAADNG